MRINFARALCLGLCVIASPSAWAGPANLVQNGNFATGDFTDWDLSGNLVFNGGPVILH